MLLIDGKNVTKKFGDRKVFEIKELKVYTEDKIGIVGVNGSGKTTLLRMLVGVDTDYEGFLNTYGKTGYIPQSKEEDGVYEMLQIHDKLGKIVAHENNSGGESTKLKIVTAMEMQPDILLADEPTTNLDMASIEILEQKLTDYRGAIVLVSHDTKLLDNVCNKIIEIDNGECNFYKGNYTNYVAEKEKHSKNKQTEYGSYLKKKDQLTQAYNGKMEKSQAIKRAPGRMGNSEARLYKLTASYKTGKLAKTASRLRDKLDKLEKKDKPFERTDIKFDMNGREMFRGKNILEIKPLTKHIGDILLFSTDGFKIENNTKTAITGNNGTGKTTLLNMIVGGDSNIYMNACIKVGYVSQKLVELDEGKSILQNVMSTSVHNETFARIILGRLLFMEDAVNKRVGIISGGERLKVAIAKMVLSDNNLIVLDEPTNHLDIESKAALIEVMERYEGNLIFVTHDRELIESVANNIIIIENQKLKNFKGTYTEYLNSKGERTIPDDKILLDIRISNIVGKLSDLRTSKEDKEKLEKEYFELCKIIKTKN